MDTRVIDIMSESPPQERANALRMPEVNTTLSSSMRADETVAATSPPSASTEANSNAINDYCTTAVPASPPNHPTRSSISLATNANSEFPMWTTTYVSDSNYGDGESSFAIICENPSCSDKEPRTTSSPASDHLSPTLSSRTSSHNGHESSAVSTPSQVSTNQAKARSTRAKESSSTAMDVVNANVHSRTLSKRASSSPTPNTDVAKEEKKSRGKGRDRKVKFIIGPSPSTSSDEEMNKGKSSNCKRGGRPDRSNKFVIGPSRNASSEDEEEETKKENAKK